MGGGSNVVTVQPFHNLAITNDGPVYFADGIRVDYHGETHLYVERKDDSYFNYFNLIAIDGTAPDGVTINVIDPFDVFVDEGAPNPYPAQTKPTIMLVGGKNVYYKYSEEADGTYANVFLAGGYGHNTLIGGTMEFGNFIPSSRVAQAHAYFANRSGFDGVGQSQINAQIANAVPPSTPDGIIGATLYAGRGGLMMGGPGNNSFYATGAGVYEMVGGNWINTFNVSPSFNGVPATYEIDGGGGASVIAERSIISPPSVTARPATLCPPPRREISRLLARARPIASAMSAVPLAASDECRAAVDEAVVDEARLVVAVVSRKQDGAGEARAERLEQRAVDRRGRHSRPPCPLFSVPRVSVAP